MCAHNVGVFERIAECVLDRVSDVVDAMIVVSGN